ncbi:hypothetical protein LEP1GSC050_4117 [Leptospira broomii serovar Hurstbridge str. 5399]|uniref:Uncharacterized protein n=1 Tax=Leptospira broomii serovar Hurstbridge str. 5399 TaxID=1049789 RepID=T0FDJ9_9LEPT|nr:hypothetical protein LEP1GSC050_4117 [Leptospira broomii serovar Hurstbridge str. 5399]
MVFKTRLNLKMTLGKKFQFSRKSSNLKISIIEKHNVIIHITHI